MPTRRDETVPLPSPAGDGVYRFTEELWELHERRGIVAGSLKPKSGARPIVALEPHPDDLTLSLAGRLAAERRPLYVISVHSAAGTAHPASTVVGEDRERVAAVRRDENRTALAALGAEIVELGMADARKPYGPVEDSAVKGLATSLEVTLADLPGGAELIAPAAVTRHPDHVLVHRAARRIGCHWFWEDIAFFPTYARSVEDRRWFDEGHGAALEAETFDITGTVLAKVAMLAGYPSQAPSPNEICGVLRYAWTVAAEDGLHDRFAERSYRLR